MWARSHGEHVAVLRVGRVVRKGSLRRRVTLSLDAAALVPSAAVAMTAESLAGGAAVAGAGAVTAGVLAVWNDRRIVQPIAAFNATVRAVSEGDLTATVSGVGRDELARMGFELNKVVLGLQKVIEAAERVTTGLDCVGRSADLTQAVLGTAREAAETGTGSLMEASETGTGSLTAFVLAAMEEMVVRGGAADPGSRAWNWRSGHGQEASAVTGRRA